MSMPGLRPIGVNLFGTVHCCRAALPAMRRAGYGKIINLSGGGATAPLPNVSSYAAAKAAVVRLTETLALEAADAGIDVNAVAPGALATRTPRGSDRSRAGACRRSLPPAHAKDTRRRRHAAFRRRQTLRVPRLGRQRWHHRQADLGVVGPVAGLAAASRGTSRQRCLYAPAHHGARARYALGGRMKEGPGVAIIGCELIGRKRAGALGPARLVACADRVLARAESLAATAPGCQAFADWCAAIKAPGVAIVIVATLHDTLAGITRAAVAARRHVLVEKPAARKASELEGLDRLAAERGVQVRIGFNHRRHRAFRDAKRLIERARSGR